MSRLSRRSGARATTPRRMLGRWEELFESRRGGRARADVARRVDTRAPPRPVPLVRQRRHRAREGERRPGSRAPRERIGLTVAMQAMNGTRPAAAGRRDGARRRDPARARRRDFPRPAVRPADGCDARRPRHARRRACAAMSALVPEADGGAPRRAGRRALEVAFENEFALAVPKDGGYAPVDASLCFSTIGMTTSQEYVDALADALEQQGLTLEQYYAELGHGQQEISTAHAPALAGGGRARSSFGRRSGALPRATGSSRRSRRSRGPRAPATAATSTSRCGRRAQPLPRRIARRPPLRRGTRLPCRGPRARPGPLRPHRAELQLVPGASSRSTGPAHSPAGATTTGRHRSACRRSSTVSRGVDERRAESGRLELQPVPRSRRTHRGRASTGSSAASSCRSPWTWTPATIPEDERARAASCGCRRRSGGARRARGRRVLTERSGRCSRRPTSPSAARSGRLPARRRGIRAAGSLLEVLSAVGLVDQHAHGILRTPPATLDEFRGLFSESPIRASGRTSRPASRTGARCASSRRSSASSRRGAGVRASRERESTSTRRRSCARRNTTGCSSTTASRRRHRHRVERLGELAAARAPVLRLETHGRTRAEPTRARGLRRAEDDRRLPRRPRSRVGARRRGAGGERGDGDPLPVQVHCGFGDADLHLWRADPSYLKPLIERFARRRSCCCTATRSCARPAGSRTCTATSGSTSR
jgi:hypothetical protein